MLKERVLIKNNSYENAKFYFLKIALLGMGQRYIPKYVHVLFASFLFSQNAHWKYGDCVVLVNSYMRNSNWRKVTYLTCRKQSEFTTYRTHTGQFRSTNFKSYLNIFMFWSKLFGNVDLCYINMKIWLEWPWSDVIFDYHQNL